MKDRGTFLSLRPSKLVRLTLLCSLKQFVRICLFVKFMLMILSLSSFCEEFGEMMSREFEMFMIGELSFFLGLQIKQLKEGTFVCQSKYVKDLLKKFGMEDAKPI